MGMQKHKKKYLFIVDDIIELHCSKDAKTGLGLVRECLVQILSHYLESQVDGQSSCTRYLQITGRLVVLFSGECECNLRTSKVHSVQCVYTWE